MMMLMRIGVSQDGLVTAGWVQHNLPWLGILALVFALFEERVPAGDLREDG